MLDALGARGFTTVPEPGRRIVSEERAKNGNALPWVDLKAFAQRAFDLATGLPACKMQGGRSIHEPPVKENRTFLVLCRSKVETREGAAFDRDVQLLLDIIHPPLLATTVGWAIWWLLPSSWGLWRALAVLPAIAGMIFDWTENAAIDGLLQAGATELTQQMVGRASLYSQAKAVTSMVPFTLLLLVVVWWGIRRRRGSSA